MYDKIEILGNSLIHHGKSSNRIYLMSFNPLDSINITDNLYNLAVKEGYTKIIAKIPVDFKEIFELKGYITEAEIPSFYNGQNDGCFMSLYIDEKRKTDIHKQKCDDILNIANNKNDEQSDLKLPDNFFIRQTIETDIPSMVDVYREVFKSYPFPIHQPEYILKTMKDSVIYYGIWDNDKLIALSSIELAQQYSNAEMTDFAVLKDYRGSNLALYLLSAMEEKLIELNIKTAYTIARAKSAGMNITFSKNGYCYGGTLTNNTDIAGDIESMNVWYKSITN